MNAPLILSDYACVPPCKPCRIAQHCEKAAMIVPPPPPPRLTAEDLADTPLTCGCKIPWPVIALLKTGGKIVLCDQHGWQPVTQKEVATAKRKLKNVATQMDILDIPDF